MKLKTLKKAISFLLGSKSHEKTATSEIIVALTKPFKPSTFTLPPVYYEVNVFPLLDLPPELVEVIMSDMITTVGPYRAVRLRFVNSKPWITTEGKARANTARIIQ
jgi:hypothetical protein